MSSVSPVSALSFANDLKEMTGGRESSASGESFSAFLGKSIDQVNTMVNAIGMRMPPAKP